MHIHILGVCGTFMGGLAIIARQAGHKVTGCDENVYPPMSTQLDNEGIEIKQGYKFEHISEDIDLYIIGNALSRGNEMVEAILEKRLAFQSGPQWLFEHVLRKKWVLAVAGTHGKTTTSSMLAWVLEYANLDPGFLIGGVTQNFGVSARLTNSPFFVIEADEYDTAFFDKRSKFVHYHPDTLVLNNLEFDHADIFKDLDSIKTQFHNVVRLVPSNGKVIINDDDPNINDVIDMGLWSEKEIFSINPNAKSKWKITNHNNDCSEFSFQSPQKELFKLSWQIIGQHNMSNVMAAIVAAQHAGVLVQQSVDALKKFKNVKRRLEVIGSKNNITIYDDFAHHPTAIKLTLEGLRAKVGKETIIAVLEARSNTMRMGVHGNKIARSLTPADEILFYQPNGLDSLLDDVAKKCKQKNTLFNKIENMIEYLTSIDSNPLHILIMSNGAFGGIHQKLLEKF